MYVHVASEQDIACGDEGWARVVGGGKSLEDAVEALDFREKRWLSS